MRSLLHWIGLRLQGRLGALLLLAALMPFWWFAGIWYQTHLISKARLRVNSAVEQCSRGLTLALSQHLVPVEQAIQDPGGERAGTDTTQLATLSYGALEVDPAGETITVRFSVRYPKLGLVTSSHYGIAVADLLDSAGMSLWQAYLQLALRLPSGQVFYGTPNVFLADPVIQSVALPLGRWEIAAIPVGGWERSVASGVLQFRLLGAIPMILLAGVAYWSLKRQSHFAGVARRNATLFRLAMQQVPAVVWTTDKDLRLTSLAGAWPDHPEPASGWVVGMPLGEHQQPADLRNLVEVHQRALAGESVALEIKRSQQPYDVRVEPMRDARGEIIGAIGVALDVGERRRAEDATRRQRDLAVALGAETDLPGALRVVLDAILAIEGLDCGGIYLVDERSGSVDLAISQGLSAAFVEAVSHYPSDAPEAAFVRAGSPAYDLYEGPETATTAARRDEGLRAIALIPVLHHGQAVACLNFGSHSADGLSLTTRQLLETIASEIGSVIARMRAETALADSEAQLRAIFDASPISIALCDANGNPVSANRACLADVGVPDVTHLQGLSIFDGAILPLDAAAQVRAGTPIRCEVTYDWDRLRRLRGIASPRSGIRYHDIQFAPLEIDGRRHILAQSVDITERKRTEAALRESQNRFRSAFHHSPIGMAILSPEGQWLEVNATVCSIVGYSEEELSNKTFQDITHPDDLETDLDLMRQMLTGEIHTYRMEKRYYHREGHVVWVLLAVSLIRDGTGLPRYFISQIEDITQRKLTEAALRESESQFRAIFAASPVAIVLYDEEGFPLKANPACLNEMGAPSLSHLRTSLFDSTALPQDMLAGIRSGVSVRREVLYDREQIWRQRGLRSPHHGITYRDVTITPLDLDGKRRFLAQSLDITERRQAEAALRESESRFRSIFEASPIAIGMYDAQGLLTHLNRSALALFGLASADDVKGFNLFEDPNLPTEARDQIRAGDVARFELSFDFVRDASKGPYGTHKTGVAHLYEQITPLIGEEPRGYLVQIEDITERKAAEVALRDSEDRYRRLVELAPDAIGVQVNGRVRYLNPAGVRMLGATDRDQVIGRPILDFVHPDYHEHVRQSVARILSEGRDTPLTEQKFLRLDSSVFDVEVTAMPLTYENERGNQVIFRDVTARKIAEEALRRSQQMESLGRLAFGVAHDFGNILAVIQAESEMLTRDGLTSATLREELQVITDSAVQGGTLVRQLLSFSRGEEPQQEILHLNILLRSLQGMLRRLLGNSVTLTVQLSPDATYFWGDRAQFTRVVLNLVTNARDAMPDGGELTIAIHPEVLDEAPALALGVEKGHYVVMVVRDSGAGIHPENLPRIFDPFFTTNRHHGRSGLGLSVVYGILQQHKSGIRVESHLGFGTAFHVYLPAVDDPGDATGDADGDDAGDLRADEAPSE